MLNLFFYMLPSNLRNLNNVDSIGSFYGDFPYPSAPLVKEAPTPFEMKWCYKSALLFTGIIKLEKDIPKPLKILDAGCGTGVSTNYLAYQNLNSQILAIDISSNSLKIAMDRVSLSSANKLSTIKFRNQSIFDLKVNKYFHFINSVGMLQHLKNPESGLLALDSFLRPGGIMCISVYAEKGRVHINSLKSIFRKLGLSANTKDIKLAKNMILNLPINNILRNDHERRLFNGYMSDDYFADLYLNPREINFSLEMLFKMIESTSLVFGGFTNDSLWELKPFLQGELLRRAMKLSRREQLELIQDLSHEINHFEFFLVKPL